MVSVALNIASNIASTLNSIAPNTTNPSNSIDDHTDLSDSKDSDYFVKGSDKSIDDCIESKNVKATYLLGDGNYESDVHEEVKELRVEQRSFLKSKRMERILADTEEV
ncbi:hypothetical protein FXO37_02934 [Capsicum annuum]|nr:hypothetical protein FXO37_02934 [Capsicum annuum]